MNIRRAKKTDIEGINQLLQEVLTVHHNGRPDLFKPNAVKYTNRELEALLEEDSRPVFVAVDEKEQVLGYAFCVMKQQINHNILTDIKTLYIDDLCVEEKQRGMHIGKQLYDYAVEFARRQGCYNLTLNVWACNPGAMKFYEKCGLKPQKTGMEFIL